MGSVQMGNWVQINICHYNLFKSLHLMEELQSKPSLSFCKRSTRWVLCGHISIVTRLETGINPAECLFLIPQLSCVLDARDGAGR